MKTNHFFTIGSFSVLSLGVCVYFLVSFLHTGNVVPMPPTQPISLDEDITKHVVQEVPGSNSFYSDSRIVIYTEGEKTRVALVRYSGGNVDVADEREAGVFIPSGFFLRLSQLYSIIGDEVIEGADAESLEFLTLKEGRLSENFYYGQNYALDNKSVYVVDHGLGGSSPGGIHFQKIEGADPKTFEVISGNISKDSMRVYIGIKPILTANIDAQTFVQAGPESTGAFRDAFSGYFLIGSEIKKFEVLDGFGKGVQVDGVSFRCISTWLCVDKDHVYFGDAQDYYDRSSHWKVLFPGVNLRFIDDAASHAFYVLDESHVYFFSKGFKNTNQPAFVSLEDVNPLTFHTLHDPFPGVPGKSDTGVAMGYLYATDNTSMYYRGIKMLGVHVESFQLINTGGGVHTYASDNEQVFFEDKAITGADPKTFTVLWRPMYEGCGMGFYSKDASHVFFENKIVEGADPETFKIDTWANGAYGSDKRGYYHNEFFIGGDVDLKTFECNYG